MGYESIGWANIKLGATWSDTAVGRDSTFSDASILCVGSDFATLELETATNEAWFSFSWVLFGATSPFNYTANLVTVEDTAGNELFSFRITKNQNTTVTPFYEDSGSQSDPADTFPRSTLTRFDIHVKTGAGDGFVKVYVNDVLTYDYENLTNGTNDIALTKFAAPLLNTIVPNEGGIYFSEFVIGNDGASSTRGLKVYSRFPETASATNNDWDGNAGNVSLTGITSADRLGYVDTDATGNRQTFGYDKTLLPSALEYKIDAIEIHSRSINRGIGVGFTHSLLSGGVDRDGATITTSSNILDKQQTLFLTDPSTSTAWNMNVLADLEFGVSSL